MNDYFFFCNIVKKYRKYKAKEVCFGELLYSYTCKIYIIKEETTLHKDDRIMADLGQGNTVIDNVKLKLWVQSNLGEDTPDMLVEVSF